MTSFLVRPWGGPAHGLAAVLFLAAAVTVLVPAAAIGGPPVRPPGPPVNVLLITVDDMNWDSVGVYGNPLPGITPNLDRLAGEGMRFNYAHVTTALCQPSRAALMTGRYPHRSGAMGFERTRSEVPTLPEALKNAGYYGVLIGKAEHVAPASRDGFSEVVFHLKDNGRDPEFWYESVKSAIAAASAAGKPFFVMANSNDPHAPFADPAVYRPEAVPVPGFLPDLPPIRAELARYQTSVHRADAMVGATLRALKESALEWQTLVIFLSDNGMGAPFAKGNCWLNSTRTPLIVRWPRRVMVGSVDERHMIGGIDIAPTILDAVGLANLKGADGRSFVPVLRGQTQEGRDVVFTHLNTTFAGGSYPMRAVVTKEFGYIWNGWSDGTTKFDMHENQTILGAMTRAAEGDAAIAERLRHYLYRTPEELYDYRADPDARTNLVDDARHAQRVADLRQRLLEHMKATGDPELEAYQRSLGRKPVK